MKKIWKSPLMLLLLSILLAVSIIACSDEPEPTPPPEPTPEVVETPQPEPPQEEPDTEEPDEIEEEEEEIEEEPVVHSDIHGAITRIEYGDNVVYLFGSIHGGREEWYPLAYIVEDAIDRADIVASEVGNIPATTMEFAALDFIIMPDGQTWEEFLPQEAYEHMLEVIYAWGMAYEDVSVLHPAFLISTLQMEFATAMTDDFAIGGFAGDISVDGYVMERALQRGIPIIGLETVEQQMEILFAPPIDVVAAQIVYWFGTPDETFEFMEEHGTLSDMANWYETNNFEAFFESFRAELGAHHEDAFTEYMREMVMNWRSTYYANEIARLLQETEESTTFFVVVGISHIIRSGAGEEFTDIVEQLEILGFEPEPLWQ